MCQRRAGERSERTAARSTLKNIAQDRAAIYPLLIIKLRPRLVRRRPVDRGDLPARHAEVHRELPALMDHVRQQEPEEVEPPYVPHLFRPGEELDRLVQLGIVCLAHLVAEHLRSEEHTSELQSQSNLVCRLLLEKKKNKQHNHK